jgi:protein-tyrosine phosphatase
VEREIGLAGCVNFRDVGGYQAEGGSVVWRRLFRSDALHELTPSDVGLLRDLGLTVVIDLRSDFERAHDGAGPHPLTALGATFVHAPIINEHNGAFMADTSLTLALRYAKITEAAGQPLLDTVTAIAEAPGAVVFHCAAGKDRTGLVSAVVLGALGVDDEDVIADYAMTGRNLTAIAARLKSHPAYEDSYQYVPQDAMTADAETMRELIADLRSRHGTMGGLLQNLGLPAQSLTRLRETLLT